LYEKCYKDNLHSIWANQELYRKGNTQEVFFNILSKNMQPVYDSATLVSGTSKLGLLRFVTNTSSGMGLIKCGSVVIPFDNQISKDTDLYKLYNTNIYEKIAEQKAQEAADLCNGSL
jgi:hypothetical protein